MLNGPSEIDEFLTPMDPLLITRLTADVPIWSIVRTELNLTECETRMTDLIYIGVTVLFFVVSGLYVRFCERL